MMTKHALLALWLSTAALPFAAPAVAQDSGAPTLQDAIGSDEFTIEGSVRTRYETYENPFGSSGAEAADLLNFRTLISAEYDAGPVRVGGTLQDSRAYWADTGTPLSTAEVNAFELVEGYVTLELGGAVSQGSSTELTAGRFLLNLGSKRLAGSPGFRNTANGFTGVRLDWTNKDRGQDLTLFYTLPQQRLPSDRAGLLDNAVEWDRESDDLRFWGGIFSTPVSQSGAKLEAYVYVLDEDDAEGRATKNRHLVTPGLRFYSKAASGKPDFEIEGAYQTGNIRTSSAASAPEVDVSAYTLATEFGYTFAGPAKPRISMIGNIASGEDPDSTSVNRFDTLFGIRRGEWGPSSSLFGPLSRNNIRDLGLRFEVKPTKRFDAFVSAHTVWLDELTDSFAKTGIRDAAGRSGRHAAEQYEARARYWIVPKRVQLDVGGAILAKGEFLQTAPNVINTDNTRYLYADLYLAF